MGGGWGVGRDEWCVAGGGGGGGGGGTSTLAQQIVENLSFFGRFDESKAQVTCRTSHDAGKLALTCG